MTRARFSPAPGPAGSLNGMFNWNHPDARPFILNPSTGEPVHS